MNNNVLVVDDDKEIVDAIEIYHSIKISKSKGIHIDKGIIRQMMSIY